MASDFNWYDDENSAEIVFPTVQAVAVYANSDKSLVIRQQGTMGEDDDLVIIPLSSVEDVIAAMRAAVKAAQ